MSGAAGIGDHGTAGYRGGEAKGQSDGSDGPPPRFRGRGWWRRWPPGGEPVLNRPLQLVAKLDHLLPCLVHGAHVAEAGFGIHGNDGRRRLFGAEQAGGHGVRVPSHLDRDPDEVTHVEQLPKTLDADRAVALLQFGKGVHVASHIHRIEHVDGGGPGHAHHEAVLQLHGQGGRGAIAFDLELGDGHARGHHPAVGRRWRHGRDRSRGDRRGHGGWRRCGGRDRRGGDGDGRDWHRRGRLRLRRDCVGRSLGLCARGPSRHADHQGNRRSDCRCREVPQEVHVDPRLSHTMDLATRPSPDVFSCA